MKADINYELCNNVISFNRPVILYTSGCGKCIVLQRKLEDAGIPFKKETDLNKLSKNGILNLPILEVNGEMYNFSRALKFIQGEKEKNAWKSI